MTAAVVVARRLPTRYRTGELRFAGSGFVLGECFRVLEEARDTRLTDRRDADRIERAAERYGIGS